MIPPSLGTWSNKSKGGGKLTESQAEKPSRGGKFCDSPLSYLLRVIRKGRKKELRNLGEKGGGKREISGFSASTHHPFALCGGLGQKKSREKGSGAGLIILNPKGKGE